MHDYQLIWTIAAGLTAALVGGSITHRLGLSPIVGYLLAGIVVGPYTPGFVADQHLAEQLAEIGVILLMFGVGLHFHLDELLGVKGIAIPGAIVQSLVATVLGIVVVMATGWSLSAGLVFGLSLSVASTVVLTRVLSDNNDLHTPIGRISIGWLVVEDLFTVLVLVLLPPLVSGKDIGALQVAATVGIAVLKIVLLAGFTFIAGERILPWMLEKAAATRSRELFTLTTLVIALGIAVAAAKLFDVSMALGAFLAGMVVGRSEFSLRAANEALPMRDAFAVLFFVSAGILLDPKVLLEAPVLTVATILIVVLGKPLAAFLIVALMRYPLKVALSVAVVLGQIGEFSFILAGLGRQLGVLSETGVNVIVAAAIVSITLNPLMYRLIDPAERWLTRRFPALASLGKEAPQSGTPSETPDERAHHKAVVIGYGPVGQTVTRLLAENEVIPCVIEMNLETVRSLRNAGIRAVYGEASSRDTLIEAGVPHAETLILSAAGMATTPEIIRAARELNRRIKVIARTTYLRDNPSLQKAGADFVLSGEGEVGLAMTEVVLRDLGATPEQVDRERDRIRRELGVLSPYDIGRV